MERVIIKSDNDKIDLTITLNVASFKNRVGLAFNGCSRDRFVPWKFQSINSVPTKVVSLMPVHIWKFFIFWNWVSTNQEFEELDVYQSTALQPCSLPTLLLLLINLTPMQKMEGEFESFYNWWYFTFTITLVVALTS
ncbi:hypothetical protein A2U01_0001487 [Trifolium medium]|uniref:Uncharacterized protein n=1 Tax=Trifolium medium TaxID=97028 RepID=A0A392M277_9FABA|nr:hypothetical protein [Trifolium medium]